MSKTSASLSTMKNFSKVVRGQEFLKTPAGMILIISAGIALIWLAGMASWRMLLGPTLKENGEGAITNSSFSENTATGSPQ